jgi:tetratricopeptide (TPR) repeat protein
MLKISVAFVLALALDELRVTGTVVPKPRRYAYVRLETLEGREVGYVYAGRDGRFQFKRVAEGHYFVLVRTDQGREVRRSIEVRSSFADRKKSVAITIDMHSSARVLDQYQVAAPALAVSERAKQEYLKSIATRGDTEKTRQHLEKAIQLAPGYEDALNDLGALNHREGHYAKAMELFERALKMNPSSFLARVNLGGTLIALGDYERAVQENLRALEFRRDDSLALAQLGIALFYMGRYGEALRHLSEVKRIDPFAATLPGLFIASIHETQGDLPAAISEYEDFLVHHPQHSATVSVTKKLSELRAALNPR